MLRNQALLWYKGATSPQLGLEGFDMPKKRGASNGHELKPVTKKQQATFSLPPELIERARDAVYWSPGWTMARLAERGLELAIAELEKKRGGAFPSRDDEKLPVGRRVG
jgi:hypothetical protein